MLNPDDPNGPKITVAKGIRIHKNAEVGRQMEAFLKQQYPDSDNIPSPRTLLKMLESLPASTTKSLSGINPHVENCKSAYKILHDTLDVFVKTESKKSPDNRDLTEQDVECLRKHIDLAARYMKNYYPHKISESHDDIGSHCIQFGLGKYKFYFWTGGILEVLDQGWENLGSQECMSTPYFWVRKGQNSPRFTDHSVL